MGPGQYPREAAGGQEGVIADCNASGDNQSGKGCMEYKIRQQEHAGREPEIITMIL